MSRRVSRGQSSVELLALVPAILLLALLAWQVAVAAHAWQIAGSAARAGARAAATGAPAEEAARAVLPDGYASRTRVVRRRTPGGRVGLSVTIRVVSVLPGLPSPGAVTREAEHAP